MLDIAGGLGGSPGASGAGGQPRVLPSSREPAARAWSWGTTWGLEPEGCRGSREQGNEDASGAPGGTGSLCWAWVPAEVGLGRGPQWPSAHFALLSRRVARATRRGEGLCPRLSSLLSTSGLHPDS